MKFDVRDLSFIGGIIGIVLFMLFGLTPAIAYGSDVGHSFAKSVFNNNGMTVTLMLVGAVTGLFIIAGAFTALFAALGGGIGTLKKRFQSK